jgi:hypothetical protein
MKIGYYDVPEFIECLTPERYITETQVIYCPAGDPSDYTGATDFTPAFAAMREELLSLRLDVEWGYANEFKIPAGIYLQPGKRYAVSAPINLTRLACRGFTVSGNGACVVGRFNGAENAGAIFDWVGTHSWTINSLNTESDSDLLPYHHHLLGRFTTTSPATDMRFNDCFAVGWVSKSLVHNSAAEMFAWRGGIMESYNQDVPALWIDSTNVLDMATLTACEGVTLEAGDQQSCVTHHISDTSIRNIQGNNKGALRITSSTDGNILAVRGVRLTQVYFTNSGAAAEVDDHPAVVIQGKVDDFVYNCHAELNVDNTTINLSHLVLYDTSIASVVQHGHVIREYFSMAERGSIDKTDDANTLTLVDADILISYNQGVDEAALESPMWGPNAENISVSGKISLGENESSLVNFAALGAFYGDIHANQVYANLTLPEDSQGRWVTPTEIRNFPSGTYEPTLTGVANIDTVELAANAPWHFERRGKFVEVSGLVNVDPTAAASTLTQFRASLPTGCTSNFALTTDVIGDGYAIGNQNLIVKADTVNNDLLFEFLAAVSSNVGVYFSVRYEVK